MVFSSDYFDPPPPPPPNWHQQQNQQQQEGGIGIFSSNDHQPRLQILPPPPSAAGNGVHGLGSIRPGSMLDRARLAQVPLPEPGLRCPRCDSSNTKFCYFNNYNLTQPRHFCKACRRYWTRGGALRNVPVGGRLRKNKRTKRAPKPTQAASQSQITNTTTTTDATNIIPSSNGFTSQMLMPPTPHLPYLPALHHLNGYPGGFGLNLGGPGAASSSVGAPSRVQQLTNFLSGSTPGLTGNGYNPFQTSTEMGHTSGFGTQITRVKPEDHNSNNHHGLNSSKNINMMGINQDEDDHYTNWGSNNVWTDLSSFNPMGNTGYGDRTRD